MPKEGPTTAEINAVALRTAAEAQAKANAASAGRGVRMAKRKYNRFVLDPREIADPATSPSQAEIRMAVERTLRKSALDIFEKAEKAKSSGKKLSKRDQDRYDHFAKEYPYLVPERRKELQKRLERFIQPAEGIRAAGEGPTTEEVNEAARRVLAETGAKARTKKKQKLTPKEGPTTAEINAVALRTAAEAQAKANAARAGRGVRIAKRKYNRFVLDPREIADPATSPSQAEIRLVVERTLRKSAIEIFEKAEKAKADGKKLSERDQTTYDHFAKEYPYLVPERRKELQKRLERFIQPAEGIRAADEGPTVEEVNEAARRILAEREAKARAKKKQKSSPRE